MSMDANTDATTLHDTHHACMCCGVHRHVGRAMFSRTLQLAHLKKGTMGLKRSTDRRSCILLCMTCHQVYDGPRTGSTINGLWYPWLTFGQVIFLKITHDSKYYDKSYIEDLFSQTPELGKFELPPIVFRANAERECRGAA